MELLTLAAVSSPKRLGPAKSQSYPNKRYKPLCTHADGFALHANTRVPRHRRKELERICKYISRPPVAQDRISIESDGRAGFPGEPLALGQRQELHARAPCEVTSEARPHVVGVSVMPSPSGPARGERSDRPACRRR